MKQNIKIPLSRPDITQKEIDAVLEVLRTPNLSLGPKLGEFEEKFASYIGAKHAVALSSGTAGLHLALLSLGIGEDDAVITTPFSFIASANCILFVRATPIFIDIEPKTFNIDPDLIEEYITNNCYQEKNSGKLIDRRTKKHIRAILPVHIFGHPCDMERIMKIAGEYSLNVVEDACEAIGAEYQGKKVGTFGDLAVFGFYPNKQMTTGEGGMVVTDDEEKAVMCRSLRNQGRDGGGGWLAHKRLGYNYRISDINCALGIAQVERIDGILAKRENVAIRYNQLLSDLVKVPVTLEHSKRSWFVYVCCLFDHHLVQARDEILMELIDQGIACSNYFPPIHLQPFYKEKYEYVEGDFYETEHISKCTLALPFHNDLKEDEINEIGFKLNKILNS